MRSLLRPTRALLPALLVTLACAACASAPRIETIPVALACASRVPPQLRDDVKPAPLPADQTVGEWVAFGDAQTGKLEQANDEKATVLWIVDQCEGEQTKAAQALSKRRWWPW